MIKIIVGSRGSGKTKQLIEQINQASKSSAGNVVCLDKSLKLKHNVDLSVRLVDIDDYRVKGFEMFSGFLLGLLSGNYDITHVFVDSILKVGGEDKDLEGLGEMFAKLDKIDDTKDVELVFTVSAEEGDLPESVAKYK